MTVVISPKIGRAMATQVDRVNAGRQQSSEYTSLHNRLQSAQDEIARLNDIIDALQHKLRNAGLPISDDDMANGRPVLSVTQASQQTGIPPHTVYRYINGGHWEATKRGAQWLVYADQPLTKKKQAKRGRKKKA